MTRMVMERTRKLGTRQLSKLHGRQVQNLLIDMRIWQILSSGIRCVLYLTVKLHHLIYQLVFGMKPGPDFCLRFCPPALSIRWWLNILFA